MNESSRKEVIELFDSGIDGSLTDERKKRLAELLRDDPAARKLYVEHCQMHAMLAWEHGTLDALAFQESGPVESVSHEPSDGAQSARRWRWSAIAASVLFIATASWMVRIERAPSGQPVAESNSNHDHDMTPATEWETRDLVGRLTVRLGAVLSVLGTSEALDATDEVRTGHYHLASGFIEIKLTNDVLIVVEAPAEFELESAMRMIMHKGRMSAIVSEQGKGFLVDTPSASLVDYGTEFSIDVSPESGSEVHVFDGEVTVRPKYAPPESAALRLTSNQATRILGKAGIPEGINIDHERFTRRLGESAETASSYVQLMHSLKPVTWLRMAPTGDGVTLSDRGSSPTDATLVLGGMTAPPFKPGRVGSSLDLGGPFSEAYAKIAKYEPAGDGMITVCAWVRAESRPRWAAIAKHWSIEFSKDRISYTGLGGQFHFGLHQDDGGLEIQVRDSDGKIVKVREDVPLPILKWHHVAFVVTGREVQLYRNGQKINSAPCNGLAIDGPSAMGIGIKLAPDCAGPNPTNPGYWHGRIDELACFDVGLNESQVFKLYSISKERKAGK